ncbi:MAG: hypothetical protein KF773_12805 [Deltaproteobacteria bacterium]|nr:hypothetical protein [Deltaproteobacteria bacterium]MCW5801461.1 hypothetical protein [Deltaproteobacteria bacterium]
MYRDDREALLARLHALEADARDAPVLRARVAKLEAENAHLREELAKLAAAAAARAAGLR